MSETETKSATLWFVNTTAWEYNDEYYYPSEGANPRAVFSDRDVAKKYVDKINLAMWRRGIVDYVSDSVYGGEKFEQYCKDQGISCEEGSGNTWEDFLNGESSMTETQVLLVLSEIGLSFAHIGDEIVQVCEDWTNGNGGFFASVNPYEDERIISPILKDTPWLDRVNIAKPVVGVCKCESCGYTNATGSTTCRLCNREIENEG